MDLLKQARKSKRPTPKMARAAEGDYDTVMKIRHILCLCALALPQLALAELPFTNEALGKVEGTLDFCSSVHPEGAAKYHKQAELLVGTALKKDVEAARKTTEYQAAYASIGAELGKVPKDQATKACAAFREDK